MNKKNVESIYPLSATQQGMLYETISAPESGIHIEQLICTLTGALDVGVWKKAWENVVSRHAILRTCFVWETQAEPVQVVLRQVPLSFDLYDWQEFSSEEQSVRLESYVKEDRQHGFKLSRPPLMRLALFQMAKDIYRMVWTHHHILMDGWCCALVLQDVLAYYQAFCKGQKPLLEPARSYESYIDWLQQQDISKAEQFWRKTLHGFTRPTPLGREDESMVLPEPQEPYGMKQISFPAATTTALQAVVRRQHLTVSTLLQGVWALLLSRYSHLDDVVFGITVSGRPTDLPGYETIVGPCINTLPMRVKLLSEMSFWSWLKEIQAYTVELRQYEYSPGGQVHQWSDVPGALLLYESLLVVENYPVDFASLSSLDLPISLSNIDSQGAQTKYALTILVTLNTELDVICIYDTHRFTEGAVAQILEHVHHLLYYLATESEVPSVHTLQNLIPSYQIPAVRPRVVEASPDRDKSKASMPLEEVLMGIWKEVLGLEQIHLHDNFFAIGGHSLLATQLISRVRSVLHIELPLRSLFEAPTVAQLAAYIEGHVLRKDQQSIPPPIIPVARNRYVPLSFAQQRLWFLQQLEPDSSTYTTPFALYMEGALDKKSLERSLAEIIRRHESLRSTIQMQEDFAYQIIKPGGPFNLLYEDLAELNPDKQEEQVQRLIQEESQRPFDLSCGPLLRMALVRLRDGKHLLLLVMHHIITDAWSMGIFVHELKTLYTAFVQKKPSPLPPLAIQYADFAMWQRQWLQGEVLRTLITYWTKRLEGAVPAKLPTDREPTLSNAAPGNIIPFSLPLALLQALSRLSRQEGATLFMTLLAAFQILLYRHTGQKDIVVGTDIANRTRVETEALIGFFVNLLALRTDLRGEPQFREVLQQVREVVLGAYAHQDLPFEKLVEVLKIERTVEGSQPPLINALFVLQNIPMPTLEMQGVTMSLKELQSDVTRFNLGIFLGEEAQGLRGYVNYNSALFDSSTITTLIERFQTLLGSIVMYPDRAIDDLEMYSEVEKQQQSSRELARLDAHRHKLKRARGDVVDTSNLHPL